MKLEGEMKKQGLNWLKRSFETGKTGFEMNETELWNEKTEFEMRKWGLEVLKKGSFEVDSFDSKKHVKVLNFGCLRTW